MKLFFRLAFGPIIAAWYEWLLLNGHPLCPDTPKWVLRRRHFTTGRWYA